jgi:hypothetical protein
MSVDAEVPVVSPLAMLTEMSVQIPEDWVPMGYQARKPSALPSPKIGPLKLPASLSNLLAMRKSWRDALLLIAAEGIAVVPVMLQDQYPRISFDVGQKYNG